MLLSLFLALLRLSFVNKLLRLLCVCCFLLLLPGFFIFLLLSLLHSSPP